MDTTVRFVAAIICAIGVPHSILAADSKQLADEVLGMLDETGVWDYQEAPKRHRTMRPSTACTKSTAKHFAKFSLTMAGPSRALSVLMLKAPFSRCSKRNTATLIF